MKKLTSLFLAVLLLLSFSTIVFADFPNGIIKCYTISTGNNTTAYNDASTSSGKKGTIYGTDELYISQINGDWVKCTYPVTGGRKEAWIPLSVVTSNNVLHSSYTAPRQITTYKRQGSGEYGYISKGDNVIVVASGSGNWRQVIYPISGAYKLAWINYAYTAPDETVQTKQQDPPIVVTGTASPLGNNSYVLNGEIIKNFGAMIRDYGFEYGTSKSSFEKLSLGKEAEKGTFKWDLTRLSNKTYYYRAWARSDAGTGYGEIESFTVADVDDESPTRTPEGEVIDESGSIEDGSSNADDNTSEITVEPEQNTGSDERPVHDMTKANENIGQIIDTTKPSEDEVVKISSITLSDDSVSLDADEYIVLDYTVLPNDADKSGIEWSSDAEDVAKVTQTGKITGVAAGTATITVRDALTGKKATCTVKVIEKTIEPSSVRLSESSLAMKIGDTETLGADILPSDAQNKQVKWSSSKPYIASVDLNGKITAKQIGTTIITVQTEAGGETDTCNVTVTAVNTIKEEPKAEKFFNDVPLGHWANVYIAEMKRQRIIDGYPDGNFYPDQQVSRAEFAKMLVLAAGRTASKKATSSFADIYVTDWCSPYVETVSNYLTGYYENGEYVFRPETVAKREDMAVAVVKLKGFDNKEYDLAELETIFIDYNKISEGLRKYVSIAIRNDIMNGYPDATFRAQDTLTRAEAATLLYNAFMNSGYGNKTTY